jgi:saccharopine dehydrogenase (NAD+, L-lysine-forming)
VVGFAGSGNVSQGAQEIFDLFPHEEVDPGELAALFTGRQAPRDRLFKVVFKEEDMVLPLDRDADFDLQDYYANPEQYRGRFADYLPSLSALVNCIYWTERYPRLISRADARSLWSAGRRNLRVVGDISCDIDGSIEFTYKSTEPDHACFVYDPITDGFKDGVEGRGIAVMAVDNLPCELPRDASDAFSKALRGYVPRLASTDFAKPLAGLGLPAELARAVITHQGALAPDYRYLEEFLQEP